MLTIGSGFWAGDVSKKKNELPGTYLEAAGYRLQDKMVIRSNMALLISLFVQETNHFRVRSK